MVQFGVICSSVSHITSVNYEIICSSVPYITSVNYEIYLINHFCLTPNGFWNKVYVWLPQALAGTPNGFWNKVYVWLTQVLAGNSLGWILPTNKWGGGAETGHKLLNNICDVPVNILWYHEMLEPLRKLIGINHFSLNLVYGYVVSSAWQLFPEWWQLATDTLNLGLHKPNWSNTPDLIINSIVVLFYARKIAFYKYLNLKALWMIIYLWKFYIYTYTFKKD